MKDDIINKIRKKLSSMKIKSFGLQGIDEQCKCEYYECINNATWKTGDGKFCTTHAFEITKVELRDKGGNS